MNNVGNIERSEIRNHRFLATRIWYRIPFKIFIVINNILSFIKVPWGKKIPYCSGKKGLSPLFVLGPGRSGNTILKREISKELDIYFPPELPNLPKAIRTFSRNRKRQWETVVDLVLDDFEKYADITVRVKGQEDYNLKDELSICFLDCKNFLKKLPISHRGLDSIIDCLIRNHMSQVGITASEVQWGDKTPWNLFYLDYLIETFSEASYIFVVRKPSAVVASYITAFSQTQGLLFEDAADRWEYSIKKIILFLETDFRHILIKYEDFCSDSKNEIERIRKLIGPRSSKKIFISSIRSDQKLLHHFNLSKPVFVNHHVDMSMFNNAQKYRLVKLEERYCKYLGYE